MKKTKLTFKRPDIEPSNLECDGFVTVAWNLNDEGMKLPILITSSPFDEDGSDVVHTIGALALQMEKHSNPGVKMMGRNVRTIMSKGFELLETASQAEMPEA